MAHSIELVKESRYVRLILAGDLTLTDHEIARADVAKVLTENGWDKLLIDAVRARPKMSVLDNFEFTRDHMWHFPKELRTAIIHHPIATEGFEFIETVGQNRGMEMKLLTDQDQALEWLLDD